jgi:flagellar M-ring protein FliF
VADAEGSLFGSSMYGDEAGIGNRFKYIRDIEASLVIKAQDVLAAKLGPNKSVVRVTAQVDDLKEKVVTVNKIDGDAKVRLTETITSSDTKGMPLANAGAAGTSSNGLGNTADTLAQPVSGKEETNTTSYDYPRTVEKTHEVGGQLLRLSVSAMVDLTPTDAAGQAGATTPASADLTQEQVEDLIKTAVGFDQSRGDQIQVVLTSFSPIAEDVDALAVPDSKQWEFVSQLARNSSLGLAAVAALLIGMMTLKKLQPIEIASGNNDQRRRELLSELSERVDQNPEAVSRILSAWLGEQRRTEGSDSPTIPLKKAA